MNADGFIFMSQYQHEALTNKIIGAFYQVYNALGFGFLEKVYENALLNEFLVFNLRHLRKSAAI